MTAAAGRAGRFFAVTAAAAALAAIASGCATLHAAPANVRRPTPAPPAAQPQPLPPATPRAPAALPRLSRAGWADPTSVSRAALTVMWTIDTATDTSQQQAEIRAAPFLTPSYAAALRASRPAAAPGAQWLQWVSHRARTSVRLRPEHDDQPAGTASVAYRQWGLTVAPVGRDGWRGNPVQVTVFVTMTRTGPGWPWHVASIGAPS